LFFLLTDFSAVTRWFLGLGYVDRGSSRGSSAWMHQSFSDTVDSGSESEDLDEIPFLKAKMPGKEKDNILMQYVKLGSMQMIHAMILYPHIPNLDVHFLSQLFYDPQKVET
jgi:hypothetical protein